MLAYQLSIVNDNEVSSESCWFVVKASLLAAAEEVVG